VERLKGELMRVEEEKVNAQLALADETYRRQVAECGLAIRARSTAMNKGGE